MTPPPPRSTLFPYTTLFRSLNNVLGRGITDDAGRQVLVASLDSGDYQVVVRRLGFQRAERFFRAGPDRKSTRLNSSHTVISYAVFCLKKKKKKNKNRE